MKNKPFSKDERITIEEVARIALEDRDYRNHIGHELDLSDDELEKTYRRLCSLLNE